MDKFDRWPPLNCLKGFQAAARLGSFSSAADALHMTQSAVSHQIKTLENYLGQELFLRANRKVVLSDAGRDFLRTTEDCLDIIADGLNRLDQYNKPNQFIVHCSSAFGSKWLLPRLDEFRRAHPLPDIWLYTTDSEPDLKLEEVHIAILYGNGHWPGLISRKLISDYVLPFCSSDYPLLQSDTVSVEDLQECTLLHGEQNETWHSWFSANGFPEINPVNGPNFTNSALLLQAAVQGQGVALGSMVLADNEVRSGKLVCPIPRAKKANSAYYVVTNPDGLKSQWQEPFLSWLVQQASVFEEDCTEMMESRNYLVSN